MWPKYAKEEILKAFPGRSWFAISNEARRLGVRRARKFIKASHPTRDDLMASLRHLRETRNLAAYQLGTMIAINPKLIARYERGVGYPRLPVLARWCAALSVELTVKPARVVMNG